MHLDYNAFSGGGSFLNGFENYLTTYCTGGFQAYLFELDNPNSFYYGRGFGGEAGTQGGRGLFVLTTNQAYFNWTDMTFF